MREMDCVEVRLKKRSTQKMVCTKVCRAGSVTGIVLRDYWLVNFPQYGEKDDIAEIPILEEDLVLLPDGMDARVNERIKAQFED